MDLRTTHKRKRDMLSAELERLSDAKRRNPNNEAGLTPFTLFTALSLVSLTETTFHLAVDWLMRPQRRGGPLTPGVSRETVQTVLEDIVIASTPEEICSWQYMESTPCPKALRAAYKILAKHHMTIKVRDANFTHGVAPSSRFLLRNFNWKNRSLSSLGVHLPMVALQRRNGLSTPRTFMYKFRKKHGLRFGRIRFGEPLTLEQKRAKVMHIFSRARFRDFGPIFGYGRRLEMVRFPAPFLASPLSFMKARPQKWVQFMAP